MPEGLQFGYPVRSDGGTWEVVGDQQHGEFAFERIRATTAELVEERAEVTDLLRP